MPSDKSEQVYQSIQQFIAAMTPGTRLPPIRSLMKQYNASQLLVDRTVRRLLGENLLLRRRDGFFTPDHPSREYSLIGYTCVNYPAEIFTEQLETLRCCAEKRKYHILYYQYDFDAPLNTVKYPPGLKAVVISYGRKLTAADLYALDSFAIPVLLINYPYHNIDLNYVSTDPYEGGMLAARYLVQQGHRHLGLFFSQPHNALMEQRAKGFLVTADLLGAKVTIIDLQVENGQSAVNKVYPFFTHYLQQQSVSFSAFFALSDATAFEAIRALTTHSYRVPDDISVISAEGIAECERFSPPLTTIGVDLNNYMETILTALETLIDNPQQSIQQLFPSQLQERSSVIKLS